MQKIHSLFGFTLVEILVGILITSSILLTGFFAISSANIGKIKLVSETQLDKEVFYFQEKMAEIIKFGGMIDYEEYFNRMVVNMNKVVLYGSGHYFHPTGFGNGSGAYYYCRSTVSGFMGTGGCVQDFNSGSSPLLASTDYSGNYQLYGQYRYMGIDYNSDSQDGDNDLGDADGDLNIIGDDDDLFLGDIPAVFSSSGEVSELYLISGDKKKRTFFRWNVQRDLETPISYPCTLSNLKPGMVIGSGCMGMIEILKLEGVDWGNDHDVSTIDSTQYDGIIDTWIYDRDFYGLINPSLALNNDQNYWTPLFSSRINVKQVSFFLFPNKDTSLAWKDTASSTSIAPYLRISLTLSPRYREQRSIKGTIPQFEFTSTFNLSPITSY